MIWAANPSIANLWESMTHADVTELGRRTAAAVPVGFSARVQVQSLPSAI